MNTDKNKKPPLIVDKKTGEERYAKPAPTRAQRVPAASANPIAHSTQAHFGGQSREGTGTTSDLTICQAISKTATAEQASAEVEASSSESAQYGGSVAKAKLDIETLEQFIAYAYSRKGQRAVLKQKVESNIAKSPRLDQEATVRLMALAEADMFLTVPRQLLLVSREVEGFPALRGALSSFVKEVMLQHPVFANPGLQDAIHNLPDAPSVANVMATVAGYEPERLEGKGALKPTELQALRRNAAYLLATWFACNRGVNLEELATLLLNVLWAPAARELADDNARLRALTEVEQFAGVGLVCQRFHQQAIEANSAQERAECEVDKLRSQVTHLQGLVEQANLSLEARTAELAELRTSAADEMAQQRKAQEAERMHLSHDLEQLRGRLVRRLDDSIEMLEVGLTALRNKTPRIEVMLERAEHVVDALRVEKNNLKEE